MALATDQEGLLLRQLILARGGSRPILDSVDYFYRYRIPQIINEYSIQTLNGHIGKFTNAFLARPDVNDLKGQGKPRPLWPYEARRNKLSYMGKLFAKFTLHNQANGQLVPLPDQSVDVYLGNVPVMVGSELCHTYGLTQQQKYQEGEPEKDPGGYFIVKGAEKVLLNIEKLRTSAPYLYENKNKYMVRYTSQTLTDTTVNVIFEDKYDVHVTFTKMGLTNNSVNIFFIFYVLGLTPDKVYTDIDYYIVDKDPQRQERRRREMRQYLKTTEQTFMAQTNGMEAPRILSILAGKFSDPNILNNVDRNALLVNAVRTELFKNIQYSNQWAKDEQISALAAKVRLLSSMVAKFVDFKNGYRGVDDRDAWGNKQLTDAGKHLNTKFVQVWKSMMETVQKRVISNSLGTAQQIKATIVQNYMSEQFINAFSKELWSSVRGSREVVVVDTLKRDNLVAAYAHIRRITTPTIRRAQIREKRLIHNTQWGVACPVTTPEGEACLGRFERVMLANGEEVMMKDLKDGDEVLTVDPITLQQTASKITNHFIKSSAEYGKPVVKVTSFNGRESICTDDHPFLTQLGWVYAKDLQVDTHYLIMYPGVKPLPHQVIESERILDADLFYEKLEELGLKESYIEKHIENLEAKQLLPLYNDDHRLPILARIAGFLLADGSLGIYNNIPGSQYTFGLPYDGELFFQDMERLGFHRNTLSNNISTIVDKVTGRECTHNVWVTAYGGCFASLLLALDLSWGRRVVKPSNPIPLWILHGSALVKREFVAGFQGGDGSKIMWHKRHDKVKAGKFNLSRTMQHKRRTSEMSDAQFNYAVDTLVLFMEQLEALMNQLGIETRGVRKMPEPDDPELWIVRLDISDAEENLLKYMDLIGYRYATTKNSQSLQLSEYIRYKQSKIQERVTFKETIGKLYKNGITPSTIAKELGVRLRQVTSILEYKGNGGTLAPKNTMGVEEWLHYTRAHNNCIMMPIKSITPEKHCMVGDFTTLSENHSMISNGFVTHNCGLVKDSSVTIYVSLDRDESILRAHLDSNYRTIPQEKYIDPLYLNGVPLGFCNAPQLRKYLLQLRRTRQQIPFDTGIVLDQYGELWISTTDGRVCRPLLLVNPDTHELLIDEYNLRGSDIDTLLSAGVMEYVDVAEQEQPQILIAETVAKLRQRREDAQKAQERYQTLIADPDTPAKERQAAEVALREINDRRPYTHCEIDPTAILGISSVFTPFVEFMPGPRATYQAGMIKQALGANSLRTELRYDTTVRTIVEPGVPSIATDAHEWLGLDEYPQGQEVILAISTYGGQNQEDAIVYNQDAIDRGMFNMLIFHGYSEVVCQSKGRQEKIMVPDNIPESQRYKYTHLDPTTGIVRIGETVTTGDALVGKVSINASGQAKNESLFVEVGKRGVVDSVIITENAEACKLIRIRLREFRKIQTGDKFASRYSQKGTVGEVMPGHEMPWVVSDNPALNGLRPHIIFNPHGIPSRMTIGKLFEMLTGILTGITGERYNATAFRRYNYQDVQDQLEKLGFSRTGKSKMVNGITGRQMDVDIFIGPIYYQLLRHLVQDKMQARGQGSIQFWTRQPTSGIRKEGGLRLGEMERDVLIEYGAAYLTQERMSISSDVWQGVVCQECGQFAINNVERGDFRCRMCQHGEFVRVRMPYSFKLMSQLLAAANIKLTLRSKET